MTRGGAIGTPTLTLATCVLRLRAARGYTAEGLAARCQAAGWASCHAKAITRTENGVRHVSVDELHALAAGLAVHPMALLNLDQLDALCRVIVQRQTRAQHLLADTTGGQPR